MEVAGGPGEERNWLPRGPAWNPTSEPRGCLATTVGAGPRLSEGHVPSPCPPPHPPPSHLGYHHWKQNPQWGWEPMWLRVPCRGQLSVSSPAPFPAAPSRRSLDCEIRRTCFQLALLPLYWATLGQWLHLSGFLTWEMGGRRLLPPCPNFS